MQDIVEGSQLVTLIVWISIHTTRSLDTSRYSERSVSARMAPNREMNGLSLSELCCLFCCPPLPGRIASKLAFLPPEATYSFVPDETGSKYTLELTERAEWQYSLRELETTEVFYTRLVSEAYLSDI